MSISDDPFVLDTPVQSTEGATWVSDSPRPRLLLPLGLLMVTLVGTSLPWVVIRPLGERRYRYNVTDLPGGMGIVLTLVFLAVPGLILVMVGKRVGLTVVALAAGVFGWMATISGLLLGFITSLLPSLDVLGLDLTKAQAGQGIGVPVTVLASLILGVTAIRALSLDGPRPVKVRIPILPIGLMALLILLGVNHHVEWLSLGSSEADLKAQLPGDALYGSGLVLVAVWIGVGVSIISLVIQKRVVMVFNSVLCLIVGAFSAVYAGLVWIGGKTASWLIPESLEGWSSVKVEPALYLTLGGGIFLFGLSFVGLFPFMTQRSVERSTTQKIGSRNYSWSSIFGGAMILGSVVSVIVRIAT